MLIHVVHYLCDHPLTWCTFYFITGLAFYHKFQVYDLGGAIATFAGFMDTKNRIKNKNYVSTFRQGSKTFIFVCFVNS
ncbi:hypothetical protein [Bacillus cereus]|uniref:hypothetical protein n=1 Tax=Bacillus cereus TaxID=1396 RepID=UPI003D2EBCC9